MNKTQDTPRLYQSKEKESDVNMLLNRSLNEGSVDWRRTDAVGPVQDQGTCGACWAFSTTATLEAANYFQTGKYKQLSAQQLVDCATDEYQNFGCEGGTPMFAMAYTD